jgi:hypothetical protein
VAVKLLDLQLIYGVAGAREKFEDLVSQLVRSEQPRADKVRIVQGDGGIDVHVGELTHPDGIDVYQCKFFPEGLKESQKGQIRKSFQACLASDQFKVKKWTLCVPVDLSVDEKTWFEEWRKNQAAPGVVIDDPWGATKLEGLLYQEKNRGIREAFFREEHLAQIRELHTTLQQLLPDIAERLRQDAVERYNARNADALARQGDALARFVQAARESYLVQVAHAATAAGWPGKRPAHWEVVIRPSWIPAHDQIDTLKKVWSLVQICQVRSNGWEYPIVENPQSGQDWVGGTYTRKLEVESWRLSQRALFIHLFPTWDDLQPPLDVQTAPWPWRVWSNFVPERFLDIDVAIRTFTHVFRFAANLAEQAFAPGEGVAELTIGLTGTRDRILVTRNDLRRLRECYRATEQELQNTWRCPREELSRVPDDFARRAALWFFERFGCHEASADFVSAIQSRIFSRH